MAKFGGEDPGTAGRGEARTYAEMLNSMWFSEEEKRQIKGEATLAVAAALLLQRGEEDVVRLLLDVVQLAVEVSSDRWEPDDLLLEVAPEHMGGFDKAVVEKIRDSCQEVSKRRDYDI